VTTNQIGGILGALVFHGVVASTRKGPGSQFLQFAASVGIGLAGSRPAGRGCGPRS
jgi:hypothetical protein